MYQSREYREKSRLTERDLFRRSLLTAILLAITVICPLPVVAATVSVTNSAGTGADNSSNGGTVTWTSPGNITAADGNNATAASSQKTAVTDYLQASSFGFNIPAGSVIRGITVNVLRSASSDTAAKNYSDVEVRLVRGGTVSAADNKANTAAPWPATPATATYGGTNDLWQESWGVADINNAGFGVVVSAARAGTGGGTVSVFVDQIEVSISYDPPPASYQLTVTSAHGTPNPFGVTNLIESTVVDAVLTGSPVISGSTQYVCTGWTGTGSVASGSGTNVSFTITNDTTITWQWQTNYWMNFATEGI